MTKLRRYGYSRGILTFKNFLMLFTLVFVLSGAVHLSTRPDSGGSAASKTLHP